MFSYRITKYNPAFRNTAGWYEKNEWTSISEIGKKFDGNKLSFEDYKKIEDAYIQAIMLFMDFFRKNIKKIKKATLNNQNGFLTLVAGDTRNTSNFSMEISRTTFKTIHIFFKF